MFSEDTGLVGGAQRSCPDPVALLPATPGAAPAANTVASACPLGRFVGTRHSSPRSHTGSWGPGPLGTGTGPHPPPLSSRGCTCPSAWSPVSLQICSSVTTKPPAGLHLGFFFFWYKRNDHHCYLLGCCEGYLCRCPQGLRTVPGTQQALSEQASLLSWSCGLRSAKLHVHHHGHGGSRWM